MVRSKYLPIEFLINVYDAFSTPLVDLSNSATASPKPGIRIE